MLVIVRLGRAKVRDKLTPLLRSGLVRRVTLIRHDRVEIESDKLEQVIHAAGLDQDGLRQPALARFHNFWLCLAQGLKVARRDKPDIVLAFNFVPYGIITWVVGRLSGAAVIVSLIGKDFNSWLKVPLVGGLLRALLRDCDRVAIFGVQQQQELLAFGLSAERVFVLPNTADTDTYAPDPTVTPDTDLIFTGYLIERKRVDLLLQALALARRVRPQTTLMIVGDGAERRTLEMLAQTLGLGGAATFAGWSDDVAGWLRRARIFVNLATAEGMPMAMLEAMCSGLPVIVTGVGAIPTVVRDGENGYLLASPADPALVAERIVQLLSDEPLYRRMREEALRVRETHGYPLTTRTWEAVLQRLPARRADKLHPVS